MRCCAAAARVRGAREAQRVAAPARREAGTPDGCPPPPGDPRALIRCPAPPPGPRPTSRTTPTPRAFTTSCNACGRSCTSVRSGTSLVFPRAPTPRALQGILGPAPPIPARAAQRWPDAPATPRRPPPDGPLRRTGHRPPPADMARGPSVGPPRGGRGIMRERPPERRLPGGTRGPSGGRRRLRSPGGSGASPPGIAHRRRWAAQTGGPGLSGPVRGRPRGGAPVPRTSRGPAAGAHSARPLPPNRPRAARSRVAPRPRWPPAPPRVASGTHPAAHKAGSRLAHGP